VAHCLFSLVDYGGRPTGIELVFYLVTLSTILGLMRLVGRSRVRPVGSPKAVP
jgi:hypothetical protein